MILCCEICQSRLGTFDPDGLAQPLGGDMFGPLEEGLPAPFAPGAAWEELRCPFCRKRPMGHDAASPDRVHPNRLLTPEGYLVVAGGRAARGEKGRGGQGRSA